MLPEPRREVQVLLHDLEVPKRIPPTRSLLRALEENGDGLDYARQVVVVTKAKAAQQSVVPLYVVQRSRLKANFHPLAAIERIADCLDDRSSNLGVGGFIAHLTSLAEISPRKRRWLRRRANTDVLLPVLACRAGDNPKAGVP